MESSTIILILIAGTVGYFVLLKPNLLITRTGNISLGNQPTNIRTVQ